MTEGIKDLSALHEVPYSNIKGAYVKVKQEVENDPLMMEYKTGNRTHTETREGTIVGRAKGTGLYYDTDRGEMMTTNECAVFLSTPEDTVLEVRTDKLENELLEFEPEGSDHE